MNEKDGEKAFDYHTQIVKNENKRRELLFDNMKYLAELHNTGLFRAVLGDEDAPWSAYLGQYDVFYSKSKVFNFVKIYNKFIKELGLSSERIASIPHSKLGLLIGVVNKENVEEWLTKSETLTSQDFNDELRIAEGKESYLNCKHENAKLYTICSVCGYRHQGEHKEIE